MTGPYYRRRMNFKDRRKQNHFFFFFCSLWIFVATGATGKTHFCTGLILNNRIIKIPKHHWCFPSPGSTIRPSTWQPRRDHSLLCLKDLSALVIFVCRGARVHLKAPEGRETRRRKQLRGGFSHLKSLWVDWFAIWVLLLPLLHSGLWSGRLPCTADPRKVDGDDVLLAGLFLHAFLGSEAGLRSSVAMGDWTSTYKTSCFTESFPEFFWTQSGLVLKAGASRRWARCAVDIGEGREANVS